MNIYEIAFLAGVSTATVSRVLNNSGCVSEGTRKKVEAVIAREEYIPNAFAHSLTTKQSHTIGIICPDIADANHAYPVAVLSHLLRAQGSETFLHRGQHDLSAHRSLYGNDRRKTQKPPLCQVTVSVII